MLAVSFGAALSTHLEHAGEVAVGHDNRTSSKMIEAAVTSGLIYGGCGVVLLDLVPTPLLAFHTRAKRRRAGVMITGSHNPPKDNGIKCFDEKGMEYSPDKEGVLERVIITRSWSGVPWDRLGKVTEYDKAKREYIEAILERMASLRKEIKVAVDCANGATCKIAPILLKKLGCKVVPINDQPDGFFPGRPPEPSKENLKGLSRIVREAQADIGIAYDGDGDRLAIVDEEGRFVSNDRVIALFAMKALEGGGGECVITSVDTSFCIDEVVQRFGGVVKRTKLGKTHLDLNKNKRVILAAEPWKIIDPSWGPWSDGVYATARLLKMLDEEENETVTQLFEDIPNYPQYRTSFFCPDGEKPKVMQLIKKRVVPEKNTASVWTFDGIRINYIDGSWLLFRASGTEPKIRLYAEGKNEQRLEEITKTGEKILKNVFT